MMSTDQPVRDVLGMGGLFAAAGLAIVLIGALFGTSCGVAVGAYRGARDLVHEAAR